MHNTFAPVGTRRLPRLVLLYPTLLGPNRFFSLFACVFSPLSVFLTHLRVSSPARLSSHVFPLSLKIALHPRASSSSTDSAFPRSLRPSRKPPPPSPLSLERAFPPWRGNGGQRDDGRGRGGESRSQGRRRAWRRPEGRQDERELAEPPYLNKQQGWRINERGRSGGHLWLPPQLPTIKPSTRRSTVNPPT